MPIENSPVLSLPYIQAAQAQKHVTHNEALRLLDIAVQLVVVSRGLTTPPAAPPEGARYIVAPSATGDWSGHDGDIAVAEGGAFWFVHPLPGWRAFVTEDGEVAVLGADNQWHSRAEADQQAARLSINTTADANNRLSIAASSSLFSHEGTGHRLTLNKASAVDTASLLFQNGFSGRAEIGTTGSDDLSIKLSADGSTWVDALTFDGVTGHVAGEAVMQSATDTTEGRLMRADYGYGPGNLLGAVSQSGGIPTGAVIETGSNSNGSYTRFADGTQICAHSVTTSSGGVTAWTFPQVYSAAPSCVASAQANAPRFTTTGAATVSAMDLDCWDITGTRQAETVQLIAFGRWF